MRTADWYGTMKKTLEVIPCGTPIVVSLGFNDHLPASLMRKSNVKVVALGGSAKNDMSYHTDVSQHDGTRDGVLSNGTPANTTAVTSTSSMNLSRITNTTNDKAVDTASPLSYALSPKAQSGNCNYPPHSVAVVGMSCRLPGADSVADFWHLLTAGTSMVEPAPSERLNLHTLRGGESVDSKWWGNFLHDFDAFDHRFFNKSSREAVQYDPQQRILLEVTYEAMESSGYFGDFSDSTPKDYGSYIGVVANNYYDNVSCYPPTAYSMLGTSRSFFSGRLNHHFGWTGPALAIDTACSSSLVAVNAACKAIQAGECSRAIAGGTNIFTSPFDYQNLAAAGFLSPTGACKPFDAAADGYCRGEGVAIVVLKSLSDAITENDNILGVITGSAVNQNENRSHITVPNTDSQSSVYHKVAKMANVDPHSVSYVEAHGTGTPVGDPIECQSIRDVFGSPLREDLLHFGSVKGNIGHTEATAGVCGLIKVLLMILHGMIPAQANFYRLNPNISPLEADRMAITTNTRDWSSSSRLACVNSYGAGGSNAAIIVRPKPDHLLDSTNTSQEADFISPQYPLFISAASSNSLSRYCQKILDFLKTHVDGRNSVRLVSDLTFNLADRGNHLLPYIVSTPVKDIGHLQSKLEAVVSGSDPVLSQIPKKLKPIVIVFGGQESDSIQISERLYRSCPLFRWHLDECNDILIDRGLRGLYPFVFQHMPIDDLVILHAALFSIQYSCARAWIDSGCKVNAVIGHSFGQLTALCISGCLTIDDALKLVVGRAQIMVQHWGPQRGIMISLQTNGKDVSEILELLKGRSSGEVAEVACYNSPNNQVLVGSERAVEALEQIIVSDPNLRDTIRLRRLRVTHGFHSRFTDPLLPYLMNLAEQLDWKEPSIHLETCSEFQDSQRPGPKLVSEHTRSPVYFHQAVARLTEQLSECTWLEAGYGSSIMQLVRSNIESGNKEHLFLSPQLTSSNFASSLSEVTTKLWKAGYPTQYWYFHRSQKQQYHHLILPPYQFEKTRHWLPYTERTRNDFAADTVQEKQSTHELLSFAGYNDERKCEAKFVVDPRNKRYRSLLEGHITAGQTLAPSSLYFELVARAALCLQSQSSSSNHVPCVEPLSMKVPIGLDTNREIIIVLNRDSEAQSSWTFDMFSRLRSGGKAHDATQHAVGNVHVRKRSDFRLAQSFKRMSSLIGPLRCNQILDDPEAEKMQGLHIYRAIRDIVIFDEQFRGIRSIAAVDKEAAGVVVKSAIAGATPDEKMCDAPMLDSMMQFAGLLVNYFTHPSDEELRVCSQIERFEIGGDYDPEAGKWIVYANLIEDSEKEILCDVYVFEAERRKLVIAMLGFIFFKSNRASLRRMLKDIKVSPGGDDSYPNEQGKSPFQPMPSSENERSLGESSEVKSKKSSDIRAGLIQLFSDVTDIPKDEISDEGTLEDLGIDSLMVTEVLNEIKRVFGVTIDMTTFLFFENVQTVTSHLADSLGISNDANMVSEQPIDGPATAIPGITNFKTHSGFCSAELDIPATQKAFDEIQYDYDEIAVDNRAADFWTQVYPAQRELVLAYVVNGYAALGCNLSSLRPGAKLPEIEHLPRHKRLKVQFDRILEDSNVITMSVDGVFRNEVNIDPTPAEELFQRLIAAYPQHASVHKLVKVPGSEIAACLTGQKDALQMIFANKENKANLDDVYANWPLVRSGTLLLGRFLTRALSDAQDSAKKFRILEIGAGTGGTTQYIVKHLIEHGIPFQYTFTDLSSSLVAAAKRQFKDMDSMEFIVLDVEKTPPEEHLGAFDIVVSTNCIHATRVLKCSLMNIYKMLKPDGVVALVEITRNMFWLDIAVGFFEGWWLFEDGRSHAVTDEQLWKKNMKEAGFSDVRWSGGERPESNTIRVIVGFKQAG